MKNIKNGKWVYNKVGNLVFLSQSPIYDLTDMSIVGYVTAPVTSMSIWDDDGIQSPEDGIAEPPEEGEPDPKDDDD
jgi:hypothetical protein